MRGRFWEIDRTSRRPSAEVKDRPGAHDALHSAPLRTPTFRQVRRLGGDESAQARRAPAPMRGAAVQLDPHRRTGIAGDSVAPSAEAACRSSSPRMWMRDRLAPRVALAGCPGAVPMGPACAASAGSAIPSTAASLLPNARPSGENLYLRARASPRAESPHRAGRCSVRPADPSGSDGTLTPWTWTPPWPGA